MGYLRRELAKLAEIHPETLRYYEDYGLIPAPERLENGYRQYTENTLEILHFIQYAKSAGLSLSEIKMVFTIAKDDDAEKILAIMRLLEQKISTTNEKLQELQTVKATLIQLTIDTPHDCPILQFFKDDSNKP